MSLRSSGAFSSLSCLNIARTLPITSPARCPAVTTFSRAARASSRSGVACEEAQACTGVCDDCRQRLIDLVAIEAESSPPSQRDSYAPACPWLPRYGFRGLAAAMLVEQPDNQGRLDQQHAANQHDLPTVLVPGGQLTNRISLPAGQTVLPDVQRLSSRASKIGLLRSILATGSASVFAVQMRAARCALPRGGCKTEDKTPTAPYPSWIPHR